MARSSLISFFDWAQYPGVSITGGTFETDFPAENMLTLQPQVVSKSTGTTLTFGVDLTTTRTIGLIHLQNFVTAVTGTIRVQAGSYDSGTVDAWPSDGGGTYSQNLHTALGRQRVFVPTVPVAASTVTVTINGVSGNLYVGFIGVCEVWETPNNILSGPVTTVIDESDLTTIPFGSTYITPRAKRRRIDFSLPPLQDDNISVLGQFTRVFDLAMINGKSSPVAVVKYPEDIDNLERNTVWGTISNDTPFTNRFYGHHDVTFQLTQLV